MMLGARKGFEIMNFYGGTCESVNTGSRKEFHHMLEYIKNAKRQGPPMMYPICRTGKVDN